MNLRVPLFIIILISASIGTTLVYHHTQQADINYYRGHRYFEKGEYHKAIKFYEKTLTITPSRLDALKDLAYSYQRTARLEKAIDCFQKVLSFTPQADKIKKSLAQTYSWNKEYEKAISLYKEVINTGDDIEAERQLAEAYIWNSQYNKAKHILEVILRKNPDDSKAKLLFAKALHYSGEVERAVTFYKELLQEEKAKQIEKNK